MTITQKQQLQNKAFGFLFLLSVILRGKAQDSCAASASELPDSSFGTSPFVCVQAWPTYNYILRYTVDESTNTVMVMLSVDNDGSWYAIGFSRNGRMVPSSAIVSWSASGLPFIMEYFLEGQTPDLVRPDKNMLKIEGALKSYNRNASLYLVFQVQLDQLSTHLIYAIGPQNLLPGSNFKLHKHRDRTSSTMNFTTGATSTVDNRNLKRNHGAVNIVGWGIFMPIGAITARYFRQFDPTWFYLHVAFQATGYMFAVAGLALGVSMVNRGASANYHKHRAIGVFVFVIASLQILALILKPEKEASGRRYWNWYHRFVGGLAIFLAIINIYVGLHLANAGDHWRVGYGIPLALIITLILIFEAVKWYKWIKRPAVQPPYPQQQQFQMKNLP